MENSVIKQLREKYSHVNLLIFHRSVEHSIDDTDLFDILDTIPELPVVWDNSSRRWSHCDDLHLKSNFFYGE